jgi:hypothetical protein
MDVKPVEETAKSPAPKAAKAKPEEKPFTELMENDFLPAAQQALNNAGLTGVELRFEKCPFPITGESCWQVIGSWLESKRQFWIGFSAEDLNEAKFFTLAANGAQPSTLESFMIDERKVSLDLLVLYILQRLNGQKWLTRN